VNVSVRKQAFTVPLPPPTYWQSLHQHTRVTTGGAELSHRIAPHRQRPVIVMSFSLPLLDRSEHSSPVDPRFNASQ
jgi:hypothetical protein